LIHWSLGSILVRGPKSEAFFERFCEHKIALVKADEQNINAFCFNFLSNGGALESLNALLVTLIGVYE
jgi:hypothetical protein